MASFSVLVALVCLAAITHAARRNDPFMEGIFQTRRTANGVMGGYAGVSRRGYPMAIAGGFATHHSPSYAAASDEEKEEEEEPVQMEDEEEQQDEVEEPEEPVQPPKAKRPTRPKRPIRPRQDEEEEEDEDDMMGGGGATAIATSYSNGKGAKSKSHAVAYGGSFTGGQFRHR